MPVELKGSCHCGAVAFTVQSSTPVPYQLCMCSICRKGKEDISIYKAVLNRGTPEETRASSERHFCSKCSAMLWLWEETWPELLHPFASAIDEPELKAPEEMAVILTGSAPAYVRLPEGKKKLFEEYPKLSLEEWHKLHNEYVE